MTYKEYLLKILHVPHISEKTSFFTERVNTVVFIVKRKAKKLEIKSAVENFFKVSVKSVNTLIVKGKTKHYKRNLGCRKDWKKAYITLKKGYHLNLDTSAN